MAASEDAKAQVKAEKAYRKASRPWFRKKRFMLPLVLVVLVVILQAATGGVSTGIWSGSPTTVTSAPEAQAVTAEIGAKARDGRFEFVVTGVERPGKTYPGKLGRTLTATGEFLIVRVNVTNFGDKGTPPLDCSCQFLVNDEGQKLTTSPAILNLKDALKYVQWVNPGDTVKGAPVLFDVVPGTKIVNIELHDSPSSPGVKVKLS